MKPKLSLASASKYKAVVELFLTNTVEPVHLGTLSQSNLSVA